MRKLLKNMFFDFKVVFLYPVLRMRSFYPYKFLIFHWRTEHHHHRLANCYCNFRTNLYFQGHVNYILLNAVHTGADHLNVYFDLSIEQ